VHSKHYYNKRFVPTTVLLCTTTTNFIRRRKQPPIRIMCSVPMVPPARGSSAQQTLSQQTLRTNYGTAMYCYYQSYKHANPAVELPYCTTLLSLYSYGLRFTVYGVARAKANNSTYSVASLCKLVNAPPSHNLPMRNKTWQLTMLSRTMKRLQTATTTYIYNGPEGILVGC
jgi:hypothetical protein